MKMIIALVTLCFALTAFADEAKTTDKVEAPKTTYKHKHHKKAKANKPAPTASATPAAK